MSQSCGRRWNRTCVPIDIISYITHPAHERLTSTPGTTCPTLFNKCVGSLTSPANHVTLKMQETGPVVYGPYPRRLECPTICRHNYKGGTFSSAFLRPWVLVWSGARTKRVVNQKTGVLYLVPFTLYLTSKWEMLRAFHTCIHVPQLVTFLLGFHIFEGWKRYISHLGRASLQSCIRIPLLPGPWPKLCGCSHCRVFSAPWNVEPAYNPESPAEQWCIQPHKSQIHGSSDSTAICEILTTVYLVHSLIKIS